MSNYPPASDGQPIQPYPPQGMPDMVAPTRAEPAYATPAAPAPTPFPAQPVYDPYAQQAAAQPAQPAYAQYVQPAYPQTYPQPYPQVFPLIPRAPERNMMVFVVSIIMTAGGGLVLLAVLMLLGMVALINSLDTSGEFPADLMALVVTGIIASAVSGVIELIVGIYGIRNSSKPDKADVLIMLGILISVVTLANLVITFKMYQQLMLYTGAGMSSAFTGVLGFILPVLFLIGAVNMKRQARTI